MYYYLIIFFENNNDLISTSYLKKLCEEKSSDSIFITTEVINTKEESVKINLDNSISNKVKNENCFITILAEEKETYNIVMNYDVLIIEKEKEKERNGKNISIIIGIIIVCLVVIVIIVIIGYFLYKYFLKKKIKTEEELLKGINGVDVNLNEDNQSSLNNDERI